MQTSKTLEEYVTSCLLMSEQDPGLLFGWHDDVLTRFIGAANQQPPLAPLPFWTTTAVGTMTLQSFKSDVIARLSLVGGGSFSNVFVAPNTLQQYTNVSVVLRDVEMDPFMQACAGASPLAPGSILATTAQVTDRTTARGSPCARVAPPSPLIQLFA